ncbi:MAG TPA: hypothetical protein PKW21_06330 [Rhabdaerophilum sp.]|nr:hypothetical protein [Rhabdaerophilum sp.]
MSASQALFRPTLRLVAERLAPVWIAAASAAMRPFRETAPASALQWVPRVEMQQGTGMLLWRESATPVDVNGGSGNLFLDGKRIAGQETPSPADDLTVYLGGKIVKREPALVLFHGVDAGLGAFAAEILPRLVAMDRLGIPVETLLLVTLNMGRQRFFQRALVDGIFRPRPVELLRRATAMRTARLNEITFPDGDPDLVGEAGDRLKALYGPFPAGGPAVLIAESDEAAARQLQWIKANMGGTGEIVVADTARMPLGKIVRAVAAAPVLYGSRGLLRAGLLAPNPSRRHVEIGNGDSHA